MSNIYTSNCLYNIHMYRKNLYKQIIKDNIKKVINTKKDALTRI